MKFQIPQFIEVEDKIIGPLTMKQFLYLGIGGAFSFVFYFLLPTTSWIMLSVFIFLAASAFAFLRINGRPLISLIGSLLNYFMKPRLYLWERTLEEKMVDVSDSAPPPSSPGRVGGKLKLLAERLHIGGAPEARREPPLPGPAPAEPQQTENGYENVELPAGETQKAKRVDYT